MAVNDHRIAVTVCAAAAGAVGGAADGVLRGAAGGGGRSAVGGGGRSAVGGGRPGAVGGGRRGAAGGGRRGAAGGGRRGAAGTGLRGPVRVGCAVAAVIISVTACQGPRLPATPASVVLAEVAAPHYSLQAAATGDEWVAVFADAGDLTLRLARGRVTAAAATVSAMATVDRIDVPPGINSDLGQHAYLVHDGVEHLFYVDQELADKRVTKWVSRPAATETASAETAWTVDLVAQAPRPVAALPRSRSAATDGFTLFGMLDQPPRLVTYRVESDTLAGPQGTELGAVARVAVSAYACDDRGGFLLEHDAGLLLIEEDPLQFRPVELDPGGPITVGCHSSAMMAAFARPEPGAGATSAGAALDAREIVAVDLERGGEVKVTLAREVGMLGVFPTGFAQRGGGGGGGGRGDARGDAAGGPETTTPLLTVLFTERALDANGAAEYRLSLVEPDGDGYRKQILVRGTQPIQDFRALRVGRDLLVAFRRTRELRLLHTQLADPPAAELAHLQVGGG